MHLAAELFGKSRENSQKADAEIYQLSGFS
jgi:hypothetical protein